MKMYFHGSIGTDSQFSFMGPSRTTLTDDSVLWFESWMPNSAGATVGVCIALVMLAVFERYLMALRGACDVSWRKGSVVSSIQTCSRG